MFKLVILILVVGAFSQKPDIDKEIAEKWKEFKKTHVKSYEPNEEPNRQLIFKDNLLNIMEHNEEAKSGKKTYWLAVNEFSDMTNKEFISKMTGLKLPRGTLDKRKKMVAAPPPGADGRRKRIRLPKEGFNWRSMNLVTPVKNQLQCGACWAFAAAGALESMWARKTGRLVPLSEQNLVDCSSSYGNQGCNGGYPNWAYEYIIRHGINDASCYPYTGAADTCQTDDYCKTVNMTSYNTVPYGQEDELLRVLFQNGPLAVCIDAGQPDFQSYSGGVYDNPYCSSDGINHAVIAVGFGHELGKNYWLIKNSWGTTWGERGFVKIARTGRNLCGVATLASQPVV